MKMLTRLMALIMALVMASALAFAETSSDDVLATVNDVNVYRSEYETHLATLSDYYGSYGYDVTDPSLLALLQQFALQTAVEYAVMDVKLVELGLALTQEEKDAAIAQATEDWNTTVEEGLVYYGLTDESTEEERNSLLVSVLAELEAMGYTEESYLEDAVRYAGYDKLYALASDGVDVSDETVVAYYNSLVEADKAIYENDAAAYEEVMYMNQLYYMYGYYDYITDVFYMPTGYRLVTHILLEADETLLTTYADLQATYEEQQLTLEEGGEVTDTLVTAEEVENARLAILAYVQPTVDEINQKLADGATFAELIPLYTTDTGMMDEASIAAGYEVHKDSVNWVIPFRDQSFTVDNIGDITEPVVTDYGVHIIQYVADVPGGPVELTDDMKEYFKELLLESAMDDAYYAAIDTWVAECNIVYTDEAKAILGTAE